MMEQLPLSVNGKVDRKALRKFLEAIRDRSRKKRKGSTAGRIRSEDCCYMGKSFRN